MDQPERVVLVVCIVFFRKLWRIFAVTILWSEHTPSKEEYAPTIQSNINQFLIHENVTYYFHMCLSITFPSFLGI